MSCILALVLLWNFYNVYTILLSVSNPYAGVNHVQVWYSSWQILHSDSLLGFDSNPPNVSYYLTMARRYRFNPCYTDVIWDAEDPSLQQVCNTAAINWASVNFEVKSYTRDISRSNQRQRKSIIKPFKAALNQAEFYFGFEVTSTVSQSFAANEQHISMEKSNRRLWLGKVG
jgi:hypothetical protein